MAQRLRYGRWTEGELLRRAQRSLGYELEVRRPGDGGVEKRIEVLAHSTVHEAGDRDFARQRTAGGEGIAGHRDIGAMAGQDREHWLGRPAMRAHWERNAIDRYLGDVERQVCCPGVDNGLGCDAVVAVGEHRNKRAMKRDWL